MEYDSELSLLSPKFTRDYPPATYPELMEGVKNSVSMEI